MRDRVRNGSLRNVTLNFTSILFTPRRDYGMEWEAEADERMVTIRRSREFEI